MMRRRRLLQLVVMLATLSSIGAFATEGDAKREIDYLIAYVEKSNARFIRNGTEYSAQEGAEHLRYKLAHSGGRVKTAEDFITGIATKSYFSGKPFQIKTSDGKVSPTGPWLAEVLAKYRKARSDERQASTREAGK